LDDEIFEMNRFMKTKNPTMHGSGLRHRVITAWDRIGQQYAEARRALHQFQCGHHFRLDDFRALPRMAAGMDPRKMRTRLFKLSHSIFLCPYFQYLLKIQKQQKERTQL
jgi:hypothetical protein